MVSQGHDVAKVRSPLNNNFETWYIFMCTDRLKTLTNIYIDTPLHKKFANSFVISQIQAEHVRSSLPIARFLKMKKRFPFIFYKNANSIFKDQTKRHVRTFLIVNILKN